MSTTARDKKRAANARVLSIYFQRPADLRKTRKAAKLAGKPLSTFIRDAALRVADEVVAA